MKLSALAQDEDKVEESYELMAEGQPVCGYDGSKALVRVRLEKNVDPADVGVYVCMCVCVLYG